MAEYIKLRLTAAKVGVSMAFIALLGGLAERARANPSSAEQPASAHFLTDTLSPPGGGASRLVIQKLDSALARLEHKLSTSFETTHKLNRTFLKIKSANTEFLKIRSANTSFLKIDDANANFLKIDDANNEFLKIDSTAVNANKLGGLTPDAFVQGGGHVITNAISSLAASNTPTSLLTVPGGVVLSVVNTVGNGVQIEITNPTSQVLTTVVDNGTGVTEHDLRPNAMTSLAVTGIPAQLHIQIFPNSGLSEVVTMIVSVENSTTQLPSFVGQAFTGGI
jgi:hypothetical protein